MQSFNSDYDWRTYHKFPCRYSKRENRIPHALVFEPIFNVPRTQWWAILSALIMLWWKHNRRNARVDLTCAQAPHRYATHKKRSPESSVGKRKFSRNLVQANYSRSSNSFHFSYWFYYLLEIGGDWSASEITNQQKMTFEPALSFFTFTFMSSNVI